MSTEYIIEAGAHFPVALYGRDVNNETLEEIRYKPQLNFAPCDLQWMLYCILH